MNPKSVCNRTPDMLFIFFISVIVLELILRKFFHIVDPLFAMKMSRNSFIPRDHIKKTFHIILKRHNNQDIISKVTFNNLGLRGRDIAIDKEPHSKRVSFLGDSFVLNSEVEDQNTIAQQLETLLNKQGYYAEVLNGGAATANSDDIIALLSHRILHLKPSTIVLFVGLADICRQQQSFTNVQTQKKNGFTSFLCMALSELMIFRYLFNSFLPKSWTSLKEVNKSAEITKHYQKRLKETKAPGGRAKKWPDSPPPGFLTNLQAIEHLAKSCGAKFMLVWQSCPYQHEAWDETIPFLHIHADEIDPQKKLMSMGMVNVEQYCKEKSIPFLNLFQQIEPTSEFWEDDLHLNATGSKRVANLLDAFIRSNNLL